MDARISPKGRERNASSIPFSRAARRAKTRSSSAASSAMTRPVAASAGTMTSCAASAFAMAAATFGASRGDRRAIVCRTCC
ncbi:MAG TPA: hypothetical protein VIL16_12255 [Trebonia sp.]